VTLWGGNLVGMKGVRRLCAIGVLILVVFGLAATFVSMSGISGVQPSPALESVMRYVGGLLQWLRVAVVAYVSWSFLRSAAGSESE
jgi:hypothetical protein